MKNIMIALSFAAFLIVTGCCGSRCGVDDTLTIEKADVEKVGITDSGDRLLITLTDAKSGKLEKLTERLMNKPLPIYIGEKLVSEPIVRAVIKGPDLELTCDSKEEAQALLEYLTQ